LALQRWYWVRPSRATRAWALALGTLAVSVLACGDPLVLIFDAGTDASSSGAGGSIGTGGAGGIIIGGAGSAGSSGAAGSSGSAGVGGAAGGTTGGLDAGTARDAGADASDASL
jgi:hypothetical protein